MHPWLEYWPIVRQWENEMGKPFAEILAEARLKCTAGELVLMFGISRGFLYTYFGDVMNKTDLITKRVGKDINEAIKELRKDGLSMEEISRRLGLSVRALYNRLRQSG